MRRVRGRSRSSSADSDGTPEKMITRHVGRRGDDDVAAGAAAQPKIHDRCGELVLFQRVQPLVRRFGGDDGEAVHLQEFHERPSDGDVVLDHHHETRGIFGHNCARTVRL